MIEKPIHMKSAGAARGRLLRMYDNIVWLALLVLIVSSVCMISSISSIGITISLVCRCCHMGHLDQQRLVQSPC